MYYSPSFISFYFLTLYFLFNLFFLFLFYAFSLFPILFISPLSFILFLSFFFFLFIFSLYIFCIFHSVKHFSFSLVFICLLSFLSSSKNTFHSFIPVFFGEKKLLQFLFSFLACYLCPIMIVTFSV